MARYPGASWRPVSGRSDGPMRSYLGAVLHVNQSTGNLYDWVATNTVPMSCHFEVYADGSIEQYIDTADDSWCQMAGNETYLSIETEGYNTDPLTFAQVHSVASLYAWLHEEHGLPFTLAEQPGQRGLGWHGMGGPAWGGHPDCPGDPRRAQRAQILALAQGDDMPLSKADLAAIEAIATTAVAKATGFICYGDGRGVPDDKNTHADANMQTITHKLDTLLGRP